MILFPSRYAEVSVHDLLRAAAAGEIGIDHRLLRTLLDRGDALWPDLLAFALAQREEDQLDADLLLVALARHQRAAAAVPVLIEVARRNALDFPDELHLAYRELGAAAIEPLIGLYRELPEEERSEVAFSLAGLGVRDPRILEVLIEQFRCDRLDGSLSLGLYGDPAAQPLLEEAAAGEQDEFTKRELGVALRHVALGQPEAEPVEPFDIWAEYPEEAGPGFALLTERELLELLGSPEPEHRAGAAEALADGDLHKETEDRLLSAAQTDPDPGVRGRCWEALEGALDRAPVRRAMIGSLEDSTTPAKEGAGIVVALAARESDHPLVRRWILDLYDLPETRAKALEAMWRTLDRRFAEYFPRHLDDPDLAVRRQAVLGVGWLGLRAYARSFERLFDDEDVRQEALRAYALAATGDNTPAGMRRMLRRIEDLAGGLSYEEGEIVRNALDDRLLLSGREAVFFPETNSQDEAAERPQPHVAPKTGRNDPCPCGSGKKYKKCCGA